MFFRQLYSASGFAASTAKSPPVYYNEKGCARKDTIFLHKSFFLLITCVLAMVHVCNDTGAGYNVYCTRSEKCLSQYLLESQNEASYTVTCAKSNERSFTGMIIFYGSHMFAPVFWLRLQSAALFFATVPGGALVNSRGGGFYHRCRPNSRPGVCVCVFLQQF